MARRILIGLALTLAIALGVSIYQFNAARNSGVALSGETQAEFVRSATEGCLTRQKAAADNASVRQNVIAGSPGSFGQDQLVLRRQPQAIVVLAMRDDDFALGREQFAAVDPATVHGEKARRRRRVFGMLSGASELIS
jgi:hypothetical protein